MPTGLPRPSVMRSILGSFTSTGLPARELELQFDSAANNLLWRDAVDLLHPRAHELDAAGRDDKRLEVVGAQVS